jgi:hypothetical protein
MERRGISTPAGAVGVLWRRSVRRGRGNSGALGRAAHATRRKKELWEASTSDKKLRRVPAMVRRGDSLVATRVGVRRECEGSIGGEGSCRSPRVSFYRERRGRGGDSQALAINAMAGASDFKTFKGGAWLRWNGREIKGEEWSRCISVPLWWGLKEGEAREMGKQPAPTLLTRGRGGAGGRGKDW